MASSGERSALVDPEVLGEVAFRRRFADFQRLASKEIIQVNLDVPRAIARGFGALPVIRANRPALEECFRKFKFALVDALEDYILALHYAHTEWLVRTEPPVLTHQMLLKGKTLRHMMLTDLKALAAHGVVDPDKWRELKRDIGHVNLASDLSMLGNIIEKCRVTLPAGLLTTSVQTREALALSKTILLAVGRSKRRDAEWLAANDQRDRVFTLFVRSYREARAGILFVKRGDKEIERQLPSLWPGKGKRRIDKPGASGEAALPRGAVGGPTASLAEAAEPADAKDEERAVPPSRGRSDLIN